MQKVKEGKFAITGEHSVFKFLVKIGINNACNFIRKHRPLTSKEEVTVTLNLHDDNQDVELSVDEQQKAQDEFLDRAFDSLPDTCKAIFMKFYWERKSMDEIADIIGYNTADSVKSKKTNCMKKFKDFAKKLLESDEFAEEAVRATAERAALRELLEEERIYAENGITMAALDIDEEPENEDN
jgi:RNA polymerase sigma factor (sigma-70 family)